MGTPARTITRLSNHFTLDELVFSSMAVRLGIDNTPTPSIVYFLQSTAFGLEKVRAALGDRPLHIDSGYRSPRLNALVGGVVNSAHIEGYAADFICPDFGTPIEIVRFIASTTIRFDQLIQEGTWVHISFDPRERMQILTAHFRDGAAKYTLGVSES